MLTGCDYGCTLLFENHTSSTVYLGREGAERLFIEVRPCSYRPQMPSFNTCGLTFVAADADGEPVDVQAVASEGMSTTSPFYLLRAGVGSGECPEPPQAALYVVARNRSGLQALLQIDGRDAQPLPPDAERRLGPLPGNPAHKFYPQVTATDPEGRALGVERVSVEQPPEAVPVMTVDILPPEEREEK